MTHSTPADVDNTGADTGMAPAERIRALNDELRKTGAGGKTYLSRSLLSMGPAFVDKACAHDAACGVEVGAACTETGFAAADGASCDNAVRFYLSNRSALEACTAHYPVACPTTPDQACPLAKEHPFESLCP